MNKTNGIVEITESIAFGSRFFSWLTPAYLPEMPQDIFGGTALIYRGTGKGYLLYSLGINEKDDGAHGHGDDPGVDDLVIRIPWPE